MLTCGQAAPAHSAHSVCPAVALYACTLPAPSVHPPSEPRALPTVRLCQVLHKSPSQLLAGRAHRCNQSLPTLVSAMIQARRL